MGWAYWRRPAARFNNPANSIEGSGFRRTQEAMGRAHPRREKPWQRAAKSSRRTFWRDCRSVSPIRKGSSSVERSKKPGTRQDGRRSAHAAITSDPAGESAFGARGFPEGAGSRAGVGHRSSRAAGKAQGPAVYFRGNKSTVLFPCTTSTLYSTTFPVLKWASGRGSCSMTSPTAEPIPDNLFFDPAVVQACALCSLLPWARLDLTGEGTVTGWCAVLLRSCTCSATR